MEDKDQWRVKVYELDEQGAWIDVGTGNAELRYVQALEAAAIVVVDENSEEVVLQSRVLPEDMYEKQGETILMWKEMDDVGNIQRDLALSFQEAMGCQHIWQGIKECQGQLTQTESTQDRIELPECKVDNLDRLHEIVSNVPPSQRSAIAAQITDNDGAYLNALLELFADLEDLEDDVHLPLLARIMRSILFLNDTKLIRLVLQDDVYLRVAGCLEYDPELKRKADYRDFLTNRAVFQQVVPITDPELVRMIKESFRMKYMKDNMLRPCLDESGVLALNALQNQNTTDICDRLFADFEYMRQICDIIVTEPPSSRRLAAITFLRELFVMSKPFTFERRAKWYEPLFDEVASAVPAMFGGLRNPRADARERQMSAETLVAALLATTQHVRRAIMDGPLPQPPPHVAALSAAARAPPGANAQVATSNDECLLYILLRRLVEEDNAGVQEQVADCIRLLIDPERMEETVKDQFLQLFYDFYIHWMFTPFVEGYDYTIQKFPPLSGVSDSQQTDYNPANPATPTQSAAAAASSRRHICDILSQCVQCHGYRAKYFVLRNQVVTRILNLFNSPMRHLHLAALKFMRTIMETKDDFYFRHIVKHDLLRPLFARLQQFGSKDSMICSAFVDIIEYIRAENIKSMITYIVEKYSHTFQHITHVDTFERLKLKYEQNIETERALEHARRDGNGDVARRPSAEARRKIQEMEASEAYFEDVDEDEEEEEDNSQSDSLLRIASYGDEDEDSEDQKEFESYPSSAEDSVAHEKLGGENGSQEQKPAFAPKRRRSNGFDEGALPVPEGRDVGDDFDSKGDDHEPLPPLRPRFESDEDVTAEVFFRNRKPSPRDQGEHKLASEPVSPATKASMNGVGAGISFAMKKKARLQRNV